MFDNAHLLHCLERFVRVEAEIQREHLRQLWARPLAERVARSYDIKGLSFTSFGAMGTFLLSCQVNISRFRDGDFLALHCGDPEREDVIEVLLEFDNETQLEVSLYGGRRTWYNGF